MAVLGREQQDVSALHDRIQQLEAVCAEVYQVLGELGAAERVLDQVWAAA
jgi:hypothetical protein